ncbi:hypothetical protein [Tsukamurella spumae]|uniref:Uncharacterized protein n=1 Tax=Tsukamurella spumae TaxID=44753 RepID=A0A846X571_9ACTN|nr:hypothetical protein [Tsukamurella spumae]NKY19666.1 hypothetical protein [Tsukamurella spumae]
MTILGYIASPVVSPETDLANLRDVLLPADERNLPGKPPIGTPDPAMAGRVFESNSSGQVDVVVDRIVSLDEIVSLDGFASLSPEWMYAIANIPANFRWLSPQALSMRKDGQWAIDVSGWAFDFALDETAKEIAIRSAILSLLMDNDSRALAELSAGFGSSNWNDNAFQVYRAAEAERLEAATIGFERIGGAHVVAGDWRGIQYFAKTPSLDSICMWCDFGTMTVGESASVREVLRGAISGVMAKVVDAEELHRWFSVAGQGELRYFECVTPDSFEFMTGSVAGYSSTSSSTEDWVRAAVGVWKGMQIANQGD